MNTHVKLPEAREICPTTSRKRFAEGALLLDVREAAEVAERSFAGCEVMNIPLSELEARWREVPADRDVVVACAVGARSLKATYFLMYHGYTRVMNMQFGMKRWLERDFPTTGSGAPMSSGRNCGSGCCDESNAAAAGDCCSPAPQSAPTIGCCEPVGQAKASSDCCAPSAQGQGKCC